MIPVYRQRIERERSGGGRCTSQPSDLVQPGHIFPIAAAAGGIDCTAPAEAAVDLTTLAGLTPAAVFTEVLDGEGAVASGDYLAEFAERHDLVVGLCQIW